MHYDQSDYEVCCEWGKKGILTLAPNSDAAVIVDVLSFSTCISIATMRGAKVYPYQWNDTSTENYARSLDAELATKRGAGRYTLSPLSLTSITPDTRLVLPSPNGATLSLLTGATRTIAGCIRNAEAVARYLDHTFHRVAVVPAGERWGDGSLRPAIEDLVGAGAIISRLSGRKSPEAQVAESVFRSHRSDLVETIKTSVSGRELLEKGYDLDVILAAELDVDDTVPILIDGAYRRLWTGDSSNQN